MAICKRKGEYSYANYKPMYTYNTWELNNVFPQSANILRKHFPKRGKMLFDCKTLLSVNIRLVRKWSRMTASYRVYKARLPVLWQIWSNSMNANAAIWNQHSACPQYPTLQRPMQTLVSTRICVWAFQSWAVRGNLRTLGATPVLWQKPNVLKKRKYQSWTDFHSY